MRRDEIDRDQFSSRERISISDADEEGIAFLQEMHQQHLTVAVILITGDVGIDLSALRAVSCGIRYFLRAPIRLGEVESYLSQP